MTISGVTYIHQEKWLFRVAFDTENKEHWYVDMSKYQLYMESSEYKSDELGFLSIDDALDLFEDLGMTLTAADLRFSIKESEKELRGDISCR